MHYRSVEALKKLAEEIQLANKLLFGSTKQRKYMALAAQFFQLLQYQRTDCLGHDLRVHDKYHRMHTDKVNLAKLLQKVRKLEDAYKGSGQLEDAYKKPLTQFNRRHCRTITLGN